MSPEHYVMEPTNKPALVDWRNRTGGNTDRLIANLGAVGIGGCSSEFS